MKPGTSVYFEELPGEIDISERKECDPPREDRFDSHTLIEYYIDNDITLSLHYSDLEEDEEKQWGAERRFKIQLSVYHLTNKETERTYHNHMTVALNLAEVKNLCNALAFMACVEEGK